MMEKYYEADADLGVLSGKKIAVIGYGSQGRGQALNLRDSGLDVVIGLRPGRSWQAATADGFKVYPVTEAVKMAQVIQVLVPDELQGSLYQAEIRPHLSGKKCLMFSHGFNIHFGQIVPPPDVDVVMVAPKGPGPMVRKMYEEGKGVPALIAVHQDYTGKAQKIALAYAKGIGGTRGGVFETTFREETETDLFGEQAVLCGGLSALIKAGFDTLVEAGYQPEMAYFECCHELKLIMDMVFKYGISGMRRRVSNTAAYGDMSRGPRVIDDYVREVMREMLREVQTGQFAKEWILECQAGRPVFKRVWEQDSEHPIEGVGAELRSHMPWLEDM